MFHLPQSQKTLFSSGFLLLSMKMQMILKLYRLEEFLYYMIDHIPCLSGLKRSRHPLPLPQNLHGLTYCVSPTATPCHPCSVPAPGLCMSTADQNKNTPINDKLKKSTPSLSSSQVTSHGSFLGPGINFISVHLPCESCLLTAGNIKD